MRRTWRAWHARVDRAVRRVLSPPNLLGDDPAFELALQVGRDGKVQIHHPMARSKDELIGYANALLVASQVIAAQAGGRIVSPSPGPGGVHS